VQGNLELEAVFFQRSEDGGENWTNPKKISGDYAHINYAGPCDLAIDQVDNINVVF